MFRKKLGKVIELLEGILATDQAILATLRHTAVGFYVKQSKGDGMTTQHLVDFRINDNGTVTYTAVPIDAASNQTTLPAGTPPLEWVASDPASLTLAADPADTSGFNLSQIGTGIKVATGVVTTCSTTLAGATAPISGSAAPLDIEAGGPVGFSVTEQ